MPPLPAFALASHCPRAIPPSLPSQSALVNGMPSKGASVIVVQRVPSGRRQHVGHSIGAGVQFLDGAAARGIAT